MLVFYNELNVNSLTTRQPESDVRAFRFPGVDCSDLPLADALHPDPKGPLQTSAELEGIAADLDDVVNESTHGSQREGRGEEHHVAKLDKHLLVVLEGVLTGRRQEHFHFTTSLKIKGFTDINKDKLCFVL